MYATKISILSNATEFRSGFWKENLSEDYFADNSFLVRGMAFTIDLKLKEVTTKTTYYGLFYDKLVQYKVNRGVRALTL